MVQLPLLQQSVRQEQAVKLTVVQVFTTTVQFQAKHQEALHTGMLRRAEVSPTLQGLRAAPHLSAEVPVRTQALLHLAAFQAADHHLRWEAAFPVALVHLQAEDVSYCRSFIN